MYILIALVAALAIVTLLQPAIKRVPWVLYLLAAAFDILYLAGSLGMLPPQLDAFAVLAVRRGLAAMALFVIVMYIGVLPHGSRLRLFYGRIRANLAIAACILIAGHAIPYGIVYLESLLAGELGRPMMAVSFALGIILVLLVIVLGVTSLRAIRRRIPTDRWLKIQRWAYPFYALVFLHPALLLLPPALRGPGTARTNLIVYAVIFGLYTVLRLWRAHVDRSGAGARRMRDAELTSQLSN